MWLIKANCKQKKSWNADYQLYTHTNTHTHTHTYIYTHIKSVKGFIKISTKRFWELQGSNVSLTSTNKGTTLNETHITYASFA